MTWLLDHVDEVLDLLGRHVVLAGVPLILGLLIALPLGWAAHRWKRLYAVLVTSAGLLYTIPSLALFILMPLILATTIFSPVNVIAAMTLYTVALLVRTVADGLASVPDHVVQAARAMGFKAFRRFARVELPLAVPVIASGLRVAAVSNVSIVSVAVLVGVPQLGNLLTDGFNRQIQSELLTGIFSCVLLALVFDVVIQLGTRYLTPWRRVQTARG